MLFSWLLLIGICLGIPAALMWGGWEDWGMKKYLWGVMQFGLLLAVSGGTLTLCGDPGSVRGG